ncbi:MAG: hypothetical protein AB7V42_02550 [Thermoleophilia bacterium]
MRATAVAAGLLAAGAVPAAAAPGWEAAKRISTAGTVSVEPAVAANARGDLAVAWRARLGRFEVVQVSLRAAGAARWTAPVTFGPIVARVSGVAVAVGPTGAASAAWYGSGGGGAPGRQAYSARATPGGVVRVSQTAVLGPAAPGAAPPAVLAAGGPALVAFTGADGRIALSAGGRAAAPLLARAPRGCARQDAPGLAPVAGGGALAWLDCRGAGGRSELRVATGTRAGSFGAARGAGAASAGPTLATVAAGPGGTALVAWSRRDAAGAQLGLAARGGARWTPLALPAAPGAAPAAPALARAAAGGSLVAWAGPAGVSVAAGPEGEAPLGAPALLAPPAPGTRLAGAGLADDGAAVVAWVEGAPARAVLRAAARPAGQPAFGAPASVRALGRVTGPVRMAAGASGRGVVAWSRGGARDGVVQAAVWSAR